VTPGGREAQGAYLRRQFTIFAFVLTLAVVILCLASGILAVSHRGLSVELFKALALLALCFALLMGCNRLLTGQWHRWSRRSVTRHGKRSRVREGSTIAVFPRSG
jgi:hypothetical protein